jgi:hypothetical protein
MEDRVESLRRGSVARTAPEGSAPGGVLAPQPMPGALGGTGHLTVAEGSTPQRAVRRPAGSGLLHAACCAACMMLLQHMLQQSIACLWTVLMASTINTAVGLAICPLSWLLPGCACCCDRLPAEERGHPAC